MLNEMRVISDVRFEEEMIEGVTKAFRNIYLLRGLMHQIFLKETVGNKWDPGRTHQHGWRASKTSNNALK